LDINPQLVHLTSTAHVVLLRSRCNQRCTNRRQETSLEEGGLLSLTDSTLVLKQLVTLRWIVDPYTIGPSHTGYYSICQLLHPVFDPTCSPGRPPTTLSVMTETTTKTCRQGPR
ncbi:unnamed protein product, partial [Laminaria digitata]